MRRNLRPDGSGVVKLTVRAMLDQISRWLTRGFSLVAVLSSIVLLANDAFPNFLPLKHSETSALPLLLIGAAYISLQPTVRPGVWELVKRLLLAVAFLLWGIVQLLPATGTTAILGDLVIALFVVDLFWIVRGELRGRS
jgi:hypothetical protein